MAYGPGFGTVLEGEDWCMIASGAVFLFVGEEEGDYMMKSGVGSLFVIWAVEG